MEERLRKEGEKQANRKVIEVDEGLLSCQICMLRYDRGDRMPLCLKCGHTVCEQCAKALIRYGRVKCPFDNKSFDYVSIEQMGKNFALLDLIDADKPKELDADERLCELHPNKKVKFYCEGEKAFVCSDCLLEHHIGH